MKSTRTKSKSNLDSKLVITADYCAHPLNNKANLVGTSVTKVPVDAKRPETIVLLIDKSGSMRSVISGMREQSTIWIDKLKKEKPEARIILAAFDDNGEILGDTHDKMKPFKIDKLKVGGSTKMDAGLDVVAAQLKKATFDPLNTVVFALTDGEDDFITSEDTANNAFTKFKSNVGPVRFVPLGYGPNYKEDVLEIIGQQFDCSHVYLSDLNALHNFVLNRSHEYLGSRAHIEQIFNGDIRKNDSGITHNEEWLQLYVTNETSTRLDKAHITTSVNNKSIVAQVKKASPARQNELIEAWVNLEVKKIIPEFNRFLKNINNDSFIDVLTKEQESIRYLSQTQKKYIEKLSCLLSIISRVNFQSPAVKSLQTMLQRCVKLQSLSNEESKDLTSTISLTITSAGRTNKQRDNQQALFGTTKFGYQGIFPDVVDRHLNFCELKNNYVVSLDAGVINRPAIIADVKRIRESISLPTDQKAATITIKKDLHEAIFKAKKGLGDKYDSKIVGYAGNGANKVAVEFLLFPKGFQNNCRHHSLLTAILLGQHHALKSVTQFRGTAHTLDAHNWVMCETKTGDRYLVDSHHGKVFNMGTRLNRLEAIQYYQSKGLHGVLAELFSHGHKHWYWDMDEHPFLSELTMEAVNGRVNPIQLKGALGEYKEAPKSIAEYAPDIYRCPLTGEIMRCPVIVYDVGQDIPHRFDYYNLLEYMQNSTGHPVNPLTHKPIDTNRIFHDLNLVREMWTFVQNCAAPKAEESNGVVSKMEAPKPVLKKLTEQDCLGIMKRESEYTRVLTDLTKLPPDCLQTKCDISKLRAAPALESKDSIPVLQAPQSTVSSVFQRLKKYLNNEADLEEYQIELSNLKRSNISNEIIDSFKQLILDVAELKQKENFLKLNKTSLQLEKNIKELMTEMSAFTQGRKNENQLNESIRNLSSTASLLTERKNEAPLIHRIAFHLKTLVNTIVKWAHGLGAAAGIVGGVAGAAVGAAGGTVAAAVVSSPVGGIAAPMGTAVGASAGFAAGASMGCIAGGATGAVYGLFKGVQKIFFKHTQDSVEDLVSKVNSWKSTKGG